MVLRDPLILFASQATQSIKQAMQELSDEGWRDLEIESSGNIIKIGSMEHSADLTLEAPPSGMGDFAFPCFQLAKERKRKPKALAEELVGKLTPTERIHEFTAMGPYLNAFVRPAAYIQEVLTAVRAEEAWRNAAMSSARVREYG